MFWLLQNKENWGPMPPKTFPDDQHIPRSLSSSNHPVQLSRQSAPLPHPPTHSSYHHRLNAFPGTPGYNETLTQGRFSTSSSQILPAWSRDAPNDSHQFDYALLQQSSSKGGYPNLGQSSENSFGLKEGSVFSEGYIPSYQEADRLFNPNDTTNHFNESRLSFGIMPKTRGIYSQDPMYETLSRYTGENRWSSASLCSNNGMPSSRGSIKANEMAALTRNSQLNSESQIQSIFAKKAPPPLPPKPRLGSSSSAQGDMGLIPNQQSFGTIEKRPSGIYLSGDAVDVDERGYSVSFV